MLLELTEILRCPADHEESYVVCVTYAVLGSHVVRGVIGCPECHAEYPIVDGVADLRGQGHRGTGAQGHSDGAPSAGSLTAESAATILGLHGPGGYVMLVGSASRLAEGLAALVPGVHGVCVNAPDALPRAAAASYLRAANGMPVKSSWMRGVVLGADCAGEPWLGEGARVVLEGLRMVVEDEGAAPAGLAELARGAGVSVWERRSR